MHNSELNRQEDQLVLLNLYKNNCSDFSIITHYHSTESKYTGGGE